MSSHRKSKIRCSIALLLCMFVVSCEVDRRSLLDDMNPDIQWNLVTSEALMPLKKIPLEIDRKVQGGITNLIQWSPDAQALAWAERDTTQSRGSYTDILSLYWPSSERLERVTLPGGVTAIHWGPDGNSLLVGCSQSTTELDSGVWEVAISTGTVEVAELSIPRGSNPRNPAYFGSSHTVLFVEGANGIGIFDTKTHTLKKFALTANFINKLTPFDSGVAYADSAYAPEDFKFEFKASPFSNESAEVLIARSEGRPFHLISPYDSRCLVFVTYATREYHTGILGVFRSSSSRSEAILDFAGTFGPNQNVMTIGADSAVSRMVFTLESENEALQGVWLAVLSDYRLIRLTPAASSSVAISTDGTRIAFASDSGEVVIVKNE